MKMQGEKFSIVHLFVPTGHTFTFRDVTITVDNETALEMKYTAMSDGKEATITVQKSQIVGWSVKV